MNLGRNSWHAKINRFVYGSYYLDDVDCLCPYFWKTILAIVLVPFWLAGHGIDHLIDKLNDRGVVLPSISQRTQDITLQTLGYSGLFGFTFLITVAVGLLIIKYGVWEFLLWLGVGVGLVTGCTFGVFGAWKLVERIREYRYEHSIVKPKKPNLVVEFVKATKDKHCPMVRWVD